MLGLRLDEPLPVSGLHGVLDQDALNRLERLGLVRRTLTGAGSEGPLGLTRRGRFLGGAVTADLIAP